MQEYQDISPKLVIHGGLLNSTQASSGMRHSQEKFHDALASIVKDSFDILCSIGARNAVLHAIRRLEDEPLFNAGTGSVLQADGQARMSAALIDSQTKRFTGVMNIQRVKNPIDIAQLLLQESNSILAGELASLYAHQHRIPDYDPITPERLKQYEQGVLHKTGTVGAVALDAKGVICAGTSTGGIGGEIPGRVSDSATVAGTYAASVAGVSCTGVGEQIINHAVAVKIVTRVQDGMPLQIAVDKTLLEARIEEYCFGLISIDYNGKIVVGKTIEQAQYQLLYASYDGQHLYVSP
ncbi:isoaspartyl peptidase/L-asparaginase [Beggiatoa leptomitoformis]|uniref:Asparaginase n=1 Tax=Beggiatoa leptomitoformis TaxID=288004 RepID=A0A2N9YD43_9GAMM|nr:isoaspartyl peptidase/L-asparaginase [Beggiatoa leptomitoformis]ALG69562.2 asparaginase [Beggiatoa leptomitoformis]AUI68413.1 asparaginase [Beggiatoa leptomitoformis]